MTDPFVLEVEGLDDLQKALDEFHDEWEPIARRALGPGLAELESEIKKDAPTDTGALRSSVGSSIERSMGSQIVGKVGSRIEYAPYALEYGRRPGRMPPPSIIEEWAVRHGMPGAGFAIARAIAARGITAPKVLTKVLERKTKSVVKKFEEGIARELKRLKLQD